MDTTRMIVLAVLAIVSFISLFFLWRWLYGDYDTSDYVIYSSIKDGLPAKDKTPTIYKGSQVPQIYSGGEYSISTWIYVTNWTINKGKNKPFLVLSGGAPESTGFMTLVMYLGQFTNKLGIRVSTDGSLLSGDLTFARDYNAIVTGVSPYTDSAPDFKKCDIEQVDLQKWVNITAVLTGRTIDIYIDGKLSRSCLLEGLFKVDGETPTIKLGGPDGFGGIIGKTTAANFAYSPDKVYTNYQMGPFSSYSIFTLFDDLSLDVKSRGQSIFNIGAS